MGAKDQIQVSTCKASSLHTVQPPPSPCTPDILYEFSLLLQKDHFTFLGAGVLGVTLGSAPGNNTELGITQAGRVQRQELYPLFYIALVPKILLRKIKFHFLYRQPPAFPEF